MALQEGRRGRTPLFLVQPIGGTVYTYLPLAKQLGADTPVHAFRASGLEPGEVLYRDVPRWRARTWTNCWRSSPRAPSGWAAIPRAASSPTRWRPSC